MMLCLVTDRRRLAPRMRRSTSRGAASSTQARHAVDAGIDLIQVRERDLEAADLAALVADLLAVTRGTRPASSSTIGWTWRSPAAPTASTCAATRSRSRPRGGLAPPGFLIGRSVHGVDDAAQAAGADYLIAGTVFPTASKEPAGTLLGLEGLRAIVAAVGVPVLAIGGITEDRLEQVAAAGAAGVAAIGLFMASRLRRDAPRRVLPCDAARRHRRTRPGAV